jgi:hypothetical protein
VPQTLAGKYPRTFRDIAPQFAALPHPSEPQIRLYVQVLKADLTLIQKSVEKIHFSVRHIDHRLYSG